MRIFAWLSTLKPAQLLTLGFLSYVVVGVLLLSLPLAQSDALPQPVRFIDNLFNVVSAMSTTGLTTISVADNYSFLGELVLLGLFQLGGIGYMTVTSFIILARGYELSEIRENVLRQEFPLPERVNLRRFVKQVIAFTIIIESVGALLLYIAFSRAGVESPLWSAIFHSVSAFATAGFSLNNNSLEGFVADPLVNVTILTLCYLGAIGFIVLQDAWMAWRYPARRVSFTSKVILAMSAAVLIVATPILYFVEPAIAALPWPDRLLAAVFQVGSASTTAGFNTVPIGGLSAASLSLVVIIMVIGASPSGTGGGIKTTGLATLVAVLVSTLRGRRHVMLWGHEIPAGRIATATAAAVLYVGILLIGTWFLAFAERQDFLKLSFEAASALGTVGLSTGITGELSDAGKCIITLLMFVGRVGPITLALALLAEDEAMPAHQADLAV